MSRMSRCWKQLELQWAVAGAINAFHSRWKTPAERQAAREALARAEAKLEAHLSEHRCYYDVAKQTSAQYEPIARSAKSTLS